MTNQSESYSSRSRDRSDYSSSSDDRSERRGGGGGGGGRRFSNRKKMCRICNKVRCSPDDNYIVDYKDVERLRNFINERGKIEPRRKLSTCALGQRAIARAIKRSRFIGLLPYTLEHVRKSGIFPLRG
jgi:small subunit ribosomal protein S18